MSQPRIERVALDDGSIAWRKTYGHPARRMRMAALRWLARRLRLSPLRAPLPLQPQAACQTEFDMIQRLAALGVPVPVVLQRAPQQLLLSDLGPTLGQCCKREASPQQRAILLQRGFDALLDLHRRGGYVSQAVVRNLTFDGERVGFIDLEEDPLSIMPLASAQARDALLFVQSSARFLASAPVAYAALLHRYLAAEQADVRAEIITTARRLRWLVRPAAVLGARARAFSEALRHLASAPW